MSLRLIEMATKSSPRRAAEAPTAATKNSCQSVGAYPLTHPVCHCDRNRGLFRLSDGKDTEATRWSQLVTSNTASDTRLAARLVSIRIYTEQGVEGAPLQ